MRARKTVWILALAAVGVAGYAAIDGGLFETRTTLGLRVEDAVTGEPVPGAVFSLVRDGVPYVTSQSVADPTVGEIDADDELLVFAYGYELASMPVGDGRALDVRLAPCEKHFTLNVSEIVADSVGTRVSVVQSLRRDPEVMLIHAKRGFLFNEGRAQVAIPVPAEVRSKAVALHEGRKPTSPLAFWITPGGSVTIRDVALKSLRVRRVDAEGVFQPLQSAVLVPDYVADPGLPPETIRALELRHVEGTYRGASGDRELVFADLPPLPMHLFAETPAGWVYRAVGGNETEVIVGPTPDRRAVTAMAAPDGASQPPFPVGWILPGWMDLSCVARLHESRRLDAVGTRFESERGLRVDGDVLLDAEGRVTLWNPDQGFAFGALDADGVLDFEPARGEITIDPAEVGSAPGRFTVSLVATYRARPSVSWQTGGRPEGALEWQIPKDGVRVIHGLPLSGYRAVVAHEWPDGDSVSRRSAETSATLSEEQTRLEVRLTDEGLQGSLRSSDD